MKDGPFPRPLRPIYTTARGRPPPQGPVDVVKGAADSDGEDEDTGPYFGVFLPAEDGSIENPYGGATLPESRLAGLLGSGDSGGPAFMHVDGRWVAAGVNSNGSGNAEAGQKSWFVRVSEKRDWILEHPPIARFETGETGVRVRFPELRREVAL